MREQGLGDSSIQQSSPAAAESPPEGSEQAQEQEYLTVAAHSKNVRKTSYVLAVLFGIGLLSLLFMIKKSKPQAAGASPAQAGTAEARIEMAIARLTGIKSEMFSRMDEIVKKFYEFSDVQQVRVYELVKNPFEYDPFRDNLREISDTQQQDSEVDLMRQQLRQQARDLQLLCILQSERGNCCMIDDEILYEGDSIKGFRVRQIGDSFVKLEWDPTRSGKAEALSKLGKDGIGAQIVLRLSD
jgi:hypothetical protein